MPLQSTYDSQILPYADLEDLKEAEIEDRVRQSLQVPQHTNDLPHRRTSQRPKRFAYTLGSQHARMANIHVLWRCGRLRAAQFHNNVLL